MEPATAPQADMAPQLTPEEEQVSGAAAVGVSDPWGLRGSLPAARSRRLGPAVASPWRPRLWPSSPETGAPPDAASAPDLLCPLRPRRLRPRIAPPPTPEVIKVPGPGGLPFYPQTPPPPTFAEQLLPPVFAPYTYFAAFRAGFVSFFFFFLRARKAHFGGWASAGTTAPPEDSHGRHWVVDALDFQTSPSGLSQGRGRPLWTHSERSRPSHAPQAPGLDCPIPLSWSGHIPHSHFTTHISLP